MHPANLKNATDGSRPSRRERLEYIADLIGELREMARDDGQTTLAGILELAYSEAQKRVQD